jgi:hypothetical protein
MPRVNRAAVNKILETAEQEVGQREARKVSSTGPALESVKPAAFLESPEKPVDKEHLEMIAFSRQMVTIVINDSAEKNAENPIYCANNGNLPMVDGKPGWLFRNKEYTIERRFVESLARAKITSYTQRDEVAPDSTPHKIMVPHTACRYPFRVIHDPHPRGADWLKSVLLEPA